MTFPASYSLDGNQSLTVVVDTSQKNGLLLLVDQDYKLVFSSTWHPPARHTEKLLTEFKKIKNKIHHSNLNKVVFISGPGSFTGLRVGAAFVKSFGLIFNCPIYCINSFKLTALHVINESKLSTSFKVCISSIGNMVFTADYEFVNDVFQKEKIHTSGAKNFTQSKEKVFSPNIELHNKFPEVEHVDTRNKDYISALIDLDQNIDSAKVHTHLDLYPLYLRKSEAEEKYSYDKIKL